MAVDKNLFLYHLAITAILKNEGHYLKEWLDYHLLAGVDHFYLYDNGSTDNYNEIIAPYAEANLVTSKFLPGESMQFAVYDEAVQEHCFECQYMAFIDLDEFIFPKSNRSVVEVVDEILLQDSNAAGLAINWQCFGSSGLETADYSRGVLERFTRRAQSDWIVPLPGRTISGGNAQVKTVANPRKINFFTSAHFPIFFEGNYSINEVGGRVDSYCNEPVTAEKIVLNHYNVKSREEHCKKISKGRTSKKSNYLDSSWFDMYDRNEVLDDSILKYRDARAENFSLADNEQRLNRVTQALIKTLSQFAADEISDLETALTCRALSHYLLEKFSDDRFKIFEEASLAAILKSIDGIKIYEVQLLLSELPNLLSLPYPAVKELKYAVIQIISQTMDFMRQNEFWRDFKEMDNLRRLLKNI
ncbi:MAG: glycosyltransferase family 92 protein [Selenomonadaceae bacterium]|nr:glycosyltransferase family 92 protein [Selenomonadaceae bacterium]